MKRFDVDETRDYIASAFSYCGEIPFLYQTFKITSEVEPDLKKEPGGYKVVSASSVFPSDPIPHSPIDPSWTFPSPCYPPDDVDLLSTNQIRR